MHGPFGIAGSGPIHRWEAREALGFLPRGWIDGLVCSNDGTDATNDIAISAGACRSTSNIVRGEISTRTRDQLDLEIPVSIIKQLDVPFAPENYDPEGFSGGGRSGGRSSSSLADGTWHLFVIGGPDVPSDILFHDGVSPAAVLPTEYTAWRMIWSIIRSTSIRPFTQFQDRCLLKTPPLNLNTSTPGTNRAAADVTVPVGIRVMGLFNVATANNRIYFAATDSTDSAAASSTAPMASAGCETVSNHHAQIEVLTDTSGQIAYRSDANDVVRIVTLGWIHPRGRNA